MQTFLSSSAKLQADFFRGLNRLVEPLVRAGFASSACSPTGLIVLETRGRKTGRIVKVPLMAMRIGSFVLVSTFRYRSQWVKNLRANSAVRYWLGGKAYDGTARVISDQLTADDWGELPPVIRNFVIMQRPSVAIFGGHIVILQPRQ